MRVRDGRAVQVTYRYQAASLATAVLPAVHCPIKGSAQARPLP